jgi:hypothetical protein
MQKQLLGGFTIMLTPWCERNIDSGTVGHMFRTPSTPFILAVGAILVSTACAAPVIGPGIESLEDGSTYTINGSGFGERPAVAPAKFDPFETGPVGAPLKEWSFSDRGRHPVYSSRFARPGSQYVAQCLFDHRQDLSSFGLYDERAYDEIYIDAWYLYEPADPPSRNHKLFRFYPGADSGLPNLYFNIYCWQGGEHLSQDGVDVGNYHKYFDWPWSRAERKWTHIQAYFKASSTTEDDGRALMWIDCKRVVDEPRFRTRTPAHPESWHSIWFGNWLGHDGAAGCGTSPGDSYTYWDDVYVDRCQARVELGDRPQYDLCSHREIQIPVEWTPASVTIRVNAGGFPEGAELYLFVIDRDGRISSASGPLRCTSAGPASKRPKEINPAGQGY